MTSAIITVATMKGGSGKSTLASCLAVHWYLRGCHPTIIDADPQRSVARLAARERALGGVPVVEDATEEAWKTARVASFRPAAGSSSIRQASARRPLWPVSPPAISSWCRSSPPRSTSTACWIRSTCCSTGEGGRRFRCVLTQTTRNSVIAKHIRAELIEAGFPVLQNEMPNRVAYPEAALWGATPSMTEGAKAAARDIAAIAEEVDGILADLLDTRQAARA